MVRLLAAGVTTFVDLMQSKERRTLTPYLPLCYSILSHTSKYDTHAPHHAGVTHEHMCMRHTTCTTHLALHTPQTTRSTSHTTHHTHNTRHNTHHITLYTPHHISPHCSRRDARFPKKDQLGQIRFPIPDASVVSDNEILRFILRLSACMQEGKVRVV